MPPRAPTRPRRRAAPAAVTASAPKPAAAPRRRRSAEEARQAILDAAEGLLVKEGPDRIRLQEVAAAVGLSHPALLHHFGSRDGLVDAVVERAGAALHADTIAAIGSTPHAEDNVAVILERLSVLLADRGHGRALAWMALSGRAVGVDRYLESVGSAVHAIRAAKRGGRVPSVEDTHNTVLLALYALLAQAVVGPALARGSEEAARRSGARFRRWLAKLLVAHLDAE